MGLLLVSASYLFHYSTYSLLSLLISILKASMCAGLVKCVQPGALRCWNWCLNGHRAEIHRTLAVQWEEAKQSRSVFCIID